MPSQSHGDLRLRDNYATIAKGSSSREFLISLLPLAIFPISVGAILAALIIGSLASSSPSRKSNHAPAEVQIAPQILNFGEVWAERDFQWALLLENPSAHDVLIDRVQTSCDCTAVNASSLVVPARGTAELPLRIDLTPKSSHDLRLPGRDVSFKVAARLQSSGKTVVWPITGFAKNPITVQQGDLDPGTIVSKGPKTISEIDVRPAFTVDNILGVCDDKEATIAIARIDENVFRLKVSPDRDFTRRLSNFRRKTPTAACRGSGRPASHPSVSCTCCSRRSV